MPPYPTLVHSFPVFPSPRLPSPPSSTLQAYEHIFFSSPSPSHKNALIFIGGLGDGPHGVPYVRSLASFLASLNFSVFEIRLTSSFSGWGYSSLRQDAAEIQALVSYLRKGLGKEKVVLMGHSTGCQDCLEYVLNSGAHPSPSEGQDKGLKVDGIILQGPVSDREAIKMSVDPTEREVSLKHAEEMKNKEEVMPGDKMPEGWRGTPVTAYRWGSLAGVGGDDDFFSSDLPDSTLAKIWGGLGTKRTPTLILPSEKDEWVSDSLDVEAMIETWEDFYSQAVTDGQKGSTAWFESGLIPGANHRVENNPEGEKFLCKRVKEFIESGVLHEG
ncbi:hypothetical protein QBC35DRAFT_491156 [Podospora australis]|uniref:Uncharacterized protein n=1 Tax=Podospora australis TaxID=1536484 RepID=A0AAN7AKH4_9PEZI|nr:hypothetical protein QBC35DRAFT_491156 [Podospora australis]